MRYELKMVFPESDYTMIVNRLISSRHAVREIYHERQINNIYFDSLDYSDYRANTHGDSNRKKYRIRWYGDLRGEIASPTLENKYKFGLSGGKKCMRLPSFRFDETFNYYNYTPKLCEIMHREAHNPDNMVMVSELLQRNPVLVNSYVRRYFLTGDKKYRITLDKKLWFANPTEAKLNCGHFGTYEQILVLEIKFDTSEIAGASDLVNELGFRISKNSKYVNGVSAIMGL